MSRHCVASCPRRHDGITSGQQQAATSTGMHLLTRRLYNHLVTGSSIPLHNGAPRCDKSSISSRQAKPGAELLLNHRL